MLTISTIHVIKYVVAGVKLPHTVLISHWFLLYLAYLCEFPAIPMLHFQPETNASNILQQKNSVTLIIIFRRLNIPLLCWSNKGEWVQRECVMFMGQILFMWHKAVARVFFIYSACIKPLIVQHS